MKTLALFLLMMLSMTFAAFSQVKEVPFTLDDRDRIMRTEEQVNSLQNLMNARFEASDQKTESFRNEVNAKFEMQNWGLGILISLMLFLLGYIIWDRRTALNPINAKTIILEDRIKKLENLSKEQAKKDPAFAEMLRAAGLL
jgi:hypothetical protein